MEEIFWKWISTSPQKSILVFEQGILLDIAHLAQINIEWIKMLFLERTTTKKGWVTVGRLLDGRWQEQNKSKLITGCFPSRANSSTDNERVGKSSLGYGLGWPRTFKQPKTLLQIICAMRNTVTTKHLTKWKKKFCPLGNAKFLTLLW